MSDKSSKSKKIGNTNATLIFPPSTILSSYYNKQKPGSGIAWDIVVTNILTTHYTLETLANEVGSSQLFLKQLINKSFLDFSFTLGAHLLGIHTLLFGNKTPYILH
jgi:hypothetical protein